MKASSLLLNEDADFHKNINSLPLPKRSCINNHDGILNQGFCSHQFVITGIVNNVDDPK